MIITTNLDIMFKLTDEEAELLWSQNATTNINKIEKGQEERERREEEKRRIKEIEQYAIFACCFFIV